MGEDIDKLRKILDSCGRNDLSGLLKNSFSNLNVSNSYGTKAYSLLSTYDIILPVKVIGEIEKLSTEDKEIILNAVRQIYPVREEMPEIYEVNYLPHFEEYSTQLVSDEGLMRIDFEYVHEHLKKCRNKIENKDFSGAITNARSLIETVCLFIIESLTCTPAVNDGNLIKLYKTVATNLNLSPSESNDSFLKQILSGAFSIVNGIASIRNEMGDAHGSAPSAKSQAIDEIHAKLAVNLAMTICDYLWSNYELLNQPKKHKS